MRRGALPEISPTLLRLFGHYGDGYLRRHFHSIRLLRDSEASPLPSGPAVVYLNHAAWWDPLVCLFLARRFFPDRSSFSPIDAVALQRYRFFRKLGFFPVEQNSVRGAAEFLRTATAVLQNDNSLLWLTPQGRFTDVRQPVELQPGVSHLARRLPEVTFRPLALEYTFWEERRPEVLLAFGKLVSAPNETSLTENLRETMGRLAAASQRRAAHEWEPLLRARGGVQPFYDFWRSLGARWRGERFQAGHSEL